MRAAPFLLLGPLLVLAAVPALAQTPAPAPPPGSTGRLFGVDDDPAPGMPASQPRVVMRLEYTGAASCPDEAVVRATIGAQVRRWDPFAPNAPWRLTVAIAHRGGGYEGSAELRDVVGAVVWSRTLAPRGRCFDLVEDLALMVALKINPPAPPAPPAPEAPPPLPETPATVPPVPEVVPAKPPGRVALRVGVGTWMDLATAPRPAFGVTADVGFRVGWFSLTGEVRWDPPAGATVMAGVDVSSALVTGALVPCGHYRWFVGCVVGEVGQFQGSLSGGAVAGATPGQQTTLYGRVGGRIGFEIPVVPDRLFVSLAANLLAAPVPEGVHHTVLHLGKPAGPTETEWESPAFTGGLGAGLVAAF